jgi:hypothetical protein
VAGGIKSKTLPGAAQESFQYEPSGAAEIGEFELCFQPRLQVALLPSNNCGVDLD